MNLFLLLVVVVAAGAVLSVQAAINGRLGKASVCCAAAC
ncbi:hypothetical protein PBOI14_29110 [Pseudomonas sp. Boi14]|nr:hypothetical protein PBOI14_29110 [Pseudomonas sp. Boi14]